MTLRMYGATSGFVDIDVPAVAGSASVVIPADAGILATQSYANLSSGLQLITSQSFSAVASVSVNNCFSATYANYRIMIDIAAMSATSAAAVRARLRASGTDNSSSNYYFNGPDVSTSSATTVGATRSAGLATWWTWGGDNANPNFSSIDIFSPQLSAKTTYVGSFSTPSTTDFRFSSLGGILSVTTAYDGFTLLPDSGTISGTIRVYGYRN